MLVPRIYESGAGLANVELLDLRAGMCFDVRDRLGKFLPAEIKAVTGNLVSVHYIGWESKWDERIHAKLEGHRFAVLGHYSSVPLNSAFKVGTSVKIYIWVANPPQWFNGTIARVDHGQVQVDFERGEWQYWVPVNSDQIYIDEHDATQIDQKIRRFTKAALVNHNEVGEWSIVSVSMAFAELIKQGLPGTLIYATELVRPYQKLDLAKCTDTLTYWMLMGKEKTWDWSMYGGLEREKSVMTEIFSILLRNGARLCLNYVLRNKIHLMKRDYLIPLMYAKSDNITRLSIFKYLLKKKPSIVKDVLALTPTDELNETMPDPLVDALPHRHLVSAILDRLPQLELENKGLDNKTILDRLETADPQTKALVKRAFVFMKSHTAKTSDKMRSTLVHFQITIPHEILDIIDYYLWREFPSP